MRILDICFKFATKYKKNMECWPFFIKNEEEEPPTPYPVFCNLWTAPSIKWMRYLLTRQTATISNRVFLLDDSAYKLGNLKRFRFENRPPEGPHSYIISEIWKFQTLRTSDYKNVCTCWTHLHEISISEWCL